MLERRVEHLQLKKNCFICLHFRHVREQGSNPLKVAVKNYCRLKWDKDGFARLTEEDCYREHDCCLYDPHKVAALDPDFQKLETHEQMTKLYEEKYEKPSCD